MSGRHPFAPRAPADVSIGDVVKFSRQGGKISKGVIKYIGHLPGKNDTYLGVELEHESECSYQEIHPPFTFIAPKGMSLVISPETGYAA